jgi:rhomboid protease GluP
MMGRTGSVLCPSCGTLVGVNDAECLTCGRRRPGLWGFTSLFRQLGDDMGFVSVVLWACMAAYLASLAVDVQGIGMSGLSFLQPSGRAEFLFGASGAIPVFRFGRWWTPLSAGWLHGGALHIALNMFWIRDLGLAAARAYGPGRAVIIYTVASVTGFLTTSLVAAFVELPGPLRAAEMTLGASAAIFGLLGALLHFGQRGGGFLLTQHTKSLAIGMAIFGFIIPHVDNWAHLGGFLGGYACAKWLDPLKPERGDHVVVAVLCLAASVAAVLASVVTGLSFFR